MCIAVAKPAGLVIDENILKTCYEANPDGAGFCVENEDGSYELDKGFFTFESFMDAFREHENKKALIHFRIRTHGKTDADNCHPFVVNDKTVFIHNGIISSVEATGDKSDTRVFKETYLQPIIAKYGQDALNDNIIKTLIESFIGGSKLAFMIKGQEGFLIFNEDKGNYSSDGVWFSNMSWQKRTYPVSTGSSWQNYNRPSKFQDKTKNEVIYLKAWNDEVYTFGTLVRLKYDGIHSGQSLTKGLVGEITRVYDDYTVDVDFYHSDTTDVNMSMYSLEVLEDLPSSLWYS